MEKTSVSVRGKAAPLFGLLALVISLLLIAPFAIQKMVGEKGKILVRAEPLDGEAVYADYVCATTLLKSGDVEGARKIIDRQQEASIAVAPNAATSGPLANYSTSALMLRLGKAMAHQAGRIAWDGDGEGAFAWVERCRMLSRQSLASSTLTIESLQLAGALDRLTLETEAQVLFALGDPLRAQKRMERVKAFDRYWKTHILKAVRDERSQCDILRFAAVTGKPVNPEELEARERRFVQEMTTLYLRERRRMRIA